MDVQPPTTGEPGWPARVPSGLFPAGPPRLGYREPHPVRTRSVLAGLAAGSGWLLGVTFLGSGLASRVWWLVAAGVAGWLAALVLARYGDRGAAVGVAVAVAAAWAGAAGAVTLYWVVTTDWPLW